MTRQITINFILTMVYALLIPISMMIGFANGYNQASAFSIIFTLLGSFLSAFGLIRQMIISFY